MDGPGEYVADRTEGITRVEELPKPKVIPRSRNYSGRPCPQCGRSCYRKRTVVRRLHDLGDLVVEGPRDLHLAYSQHYCCKCKRYFNVDMSDLAPPKSHYTRRVIALAVRLVVEDGLPYRAASWHLWRDTECSSLTPPSRTGWRPGEKGRGARRRRVSQRRAG